MANGFRRVDTLELHHYKLPVNGGTLHVSSDLVDECVGKDRYFSIIQIQKDGDLDNKYITLYRETGKIVTSEQDMDMSQFLRYISLIEDDENLPEDLRVGLLELLNTIEEQEAVRARKTK